MAAYVLLRRLLARRRERRLVQSGQLVGAQITDLEHSGSTADGRVSVALSIATPIGGRLESPRDNQVRLGGKQLNVGPEHSHLAGSFVDLWVNPDNPAEAIIDPIAALAIDRLASPYSSTDRAPAVL